MSYLDGAGVARLWAKVKALTAGCAQTSQLEGVMRLAGDVIWEEDLPETAQKGDVYNVMITDMNYVWDGTQWDPLGQAIEDNPISDELIDELFTLI